ncbi:MAG: FHA domain-containing protein, partial [Novipirellula sp. JB048]
MNTKAARTHLTPPATEDRSTCAGVGAYLVLNSAGRWSDVFRLSPPAGAFLGRASANQIVIRSDQASRQHARIHWIASPHASPPAANPAPSPSAAAPPSPPPPTGRWAIEDLASRNGTYVNGTKITAPHMLCDGDQIEIAGFSIQFTHAIHRGAGGSDPATAAAAPATAAADDQATIEISAESITDRRRHSDYLHDPSLGSTPNRGEPRPLGADPLAIRGRLLKLAFTLARLEETESAVAACLDDLVTHL